MEVIVVSTPERRPGEGALAAALLEAGVARYHLRKPDAPPETLFEFFLELPEALRPRVTIHGPAALARTLGAGGGHGLEGGPAVGLRWSVSLHALELPLFHWDYAFLAPVYDSLSKAGRFGAFTRAALREWNDRRRAAGDARPVYAQSGITPTRLRECRALGFSGVVSLGYIWGAGDPLANARELLRAAREAAP